MKNSIVDVPAYLKLFNRVFYQTQEKNPAFDYVTQIINTAFAKFMPREKLVFN